MAITKTGVLIDTSTSFNNPTRFEVNGEANKVEVTGLTRNTQYYAKAYVIKDGSVIEDRSYQGFVTDNNYDYLTIINKNNSNTITLSKNGSPLDITLYYTTDDGSTWTQWDSANGDLSVSLTPNQTLSFRGTNSTFSTATDSNYSFNSTNYVDLAGDVTSLLDTSGNVQTLPDYAFSGLFSGMYVVDASNIILPTMVLSRYCYSYMFAGCRYLTSTPALPATTLAIYCYYSMFYRCEQLVTAPELPSINLANACYQDMFEWCSSLINAPELPAEILKPNCYNGMFKECTSLINAPELASTSLALACYRYMFEGCTSLINTQRILPARELAQSCYYNMYAGCNRLRTAPEMAATVLAQTCCYGMFQGTNIEVSPVLPDARLEPECYRGMFFNCTSLKKIISNITTYSNTNNEFLVWVRNVYQTGDFYNLGRAQFPTGDNGIPTGWTEYNSL